MRLGLIAPALLAAVSVSSVAKATSFDFNIAAGGLDPSTPFFSAGGSFETAGSDGTFTLASGLQDFNLTGVEGVFLIGGYFSPTAADLASFSATLDHGTLTALSFGSNGFPVHQWFLGIADVGIPDATVQFQVAGLAPGNFTFTTDVTLDEELRPVFGQVGPFSGDLTVGSSPAPEPASWAMMLGGFGLVGGAMRARRRTLAVRFG